MGSPGDGDGDAGFDDLLSDIMENPEQLLDSEKYTPEQVLELQKRLNPYSYVPDGGQSSETIRSAAMSFTNLREEYLRRFTMTSLVGFLFRMADEWEAPDEDRRWTPKRSKKGGDPLTPDELVERAEALLDLAKVAKEAEVEAAEATSAARDADEELSEAAGLDESVIALKKESRDALLVKADAALAKSRGMQYVAMREMRKAGTECDKGFAAMTRQARVHRSVREVIDKDPAQQTETNQIEMPPAVAKGLVNKFLRAWFEFNPDAHVRKAYDEFVIAGDLAKTEVDGLGEVLADSKDPSRLPLEVVCAAAPAFPDTEQGAVDREAFKTITASRDAYNAAAYIMRNESVALAVLVALDAGERFQRYLFPIPKSSPARAAATVVPPQDTFHRWAYYTEVNFEELRTATEAIYHERPDLEMAMILYETFEGTRAEVDSKFETFRAKHEDEVISDIKGVDFGGWTLLGDFKENRSKLQFYNKHTDVLKRILDRHAQDKKLGQELMRDRVRKLKRENIRRDGPDAPGLEEHRAQEAHKALGTMGAERVISREEMLRVERARGDIHAEKELEVIDQCRATIDELSASAKVRELKPEETRRLKDAQGDLTRALEMVEVPEDAIQVDVWTHDTAKGEFGKSKFYTKAEAPAHLLEGDDPHVSSDGPKALPAAARRAPNLPVDTSASDLAPFAQEHLAREIAAGRLAEAEASGPDA